MTNEIDFPTADEIVARCRDFVAKGGRIIAGGWGDGVTCGCPMTILGRVDPESGDDLPQGLADFVLGFDYGSENPRFAMHYLGAEVRRRLEAEGLMAAQ